MHAFLFIGQNISSTNEQIERFIANQKAKKLNFVLQKIEDVRELKKIIKFSFAEKNAVIINDIDKITQEAANAFLKNLEEPNKNLIYILSASNINNVLPTIISRCEVIRLQESKSRKTTETKAPDYKTALNIKERNEAIDFVENYLLYLEANLKQKPHLILNCEICLNTIKNLMLNGNVSLQLANFVVKMSSTTN